MDKFKRVFLVVLDSVGIGEAPDAEQYNDIGANTLGNIAKHVEGLHLPNLQALGLGNIAPIDGVATVSSPKAHYTKMEVAPAGKDTMSVLWEIACLRIVQRIHTFI